MNLSSRTKIIIGGVLLIAIVIFITTIQPKLQEGFFRPFIPASTSLKKNNDSITKLLANKTVNIKTLESALRKRKDEIANLLKTDPNKIQEVMLSSASLRKIPRNLLDFVETRRTVSGKLEIEHIDDFERGISRYEYFLRTPAGETIRLYFGREIHLEPQAVMSFDGIYLKNIGLSIIKKPIINPQALRFIFESQREEEEEPAPEEDSGIPRPIKVIRVDQSRSGNESGFFEQRALEYGITQLRDYYRRNTYNGLSVSGEIVDEIVPITSYDTSQGLDTLVSRVDSSVDFRTHDYYLFIDSQQDRCPGRGSVGKRTFSTGEGEREIAVAYVDLGCDSLWGSLEAIFHEVGHNLGLKHADGWVCRDIPMSERNWDYDCVDYYGDDSVMGGGHEDLGPSQRKKLLDTVPIATQMVMGSGEYTIYPIDTATEDTPGHYEEIRVPRENGWYSIEYRRSDPGGVIVRFVANPESDIAEHIDDALRMGGSETALFRTGESFTDSIRGISVSVLRLQEDRAELRITL